MAGTAERPSLNELIKGAQSTEAAKVKEDIDTIRKERAKIIAKIKEARRRLGYKEEEFAALDKLVTMNKEKDKDNAAEKRYNYLRRLKNRLEFRISTEAGSLQKEKEMIREISSINQELASLSATVRMDRKLGLVKGDIVEAKAKLAELEPKIVEIDTKLDLMYADLRKMLGITKRPMPPEPQYRPRQREREEGRPRQQPKQEEINLEDIVVIKKKGGDKENK
jgi:uncharacterized coiled-coil DUF342 family protein